MPFAECSVDIHAHWQECTYVIFQSNTRISLIVVPHQHPHPQMRISKLWLDSDVGSFGWIWMYPHLESCWKGVSFFFYRNAIWSHFACRLQAEDTDAESHSEWTGSRIVKFAISLASVWKLSEEYYKFFNNWEISTASGSGWAPTGLLQEVGKCIHRKILKSAKCISTSYRKFISVALPWLGGHTPATSRLSHAPPLAWGPAKFHFLKRFKVLENESLF